jgi:hypothetical protein
MPGMHVPTMPAFHTPAMPSPMLCISAMPMPTAPAIDFYDCYPPKSD